MSRDRTDEPGGLKPATGGEMFDSWQRGERNGQNPGLSGREYWFFISAADLPAGSSLVLGYGGEGEELCIGIGDRRGDTW